MPDDDAAAALVLLRQLQDAVDIHMRRVVADIEMQIEIDIVFAGQCKMRSICALGSLS